MKKKLTIYVVTGPQIYTGERVVLLVTASKNAAHEWRKIQFDVACEFIKKNAPRDQVEEMMVNASYLYRVEKWSVHA